jgi:hypothetical protein
MYYPFCISLSVTAHTAIAAAVDLSYRYPATIHTADCGARALMDVHVAKTESLRETTRDQERKN